MICIADRASSLVITFDAMTVSSNESERAMHKVHIKDVIEVN